jgi:2-polyprenyl-3-methyl-5-hydroxy-6-metoxy-1,4-benzoquinol methylase
VTRGTTAGEWPSDELERLGRCPLCGAEERRIMYAELTDRDYGCAPGSWTLRSCDRCSCAYLDPRPTRDSIHRAYLNYYEGAADPRRLMHTTHDGIRQIRRAIRNGYLNARFRSTLQPASRLGPLVMRLLPRQRERADRSVMYLERPHRHPSLLDVGCGDGSFLLHMQAAGWSGAGIDPSPEAVGLARNAGLNVREGILEAATFPESAFDAVVMNRVLELLHDPHATVTLCRRTLRPGGVLALATPNLASQGHALFCRDWLLLSPPRSLVLFTRRSLQYVLERAGFERVAFFPSRTTEWSFRLSAALAAGKMPFENPPPLTPRLRLRAKIADVRASRNPLAGEELITLARRPVAATS